MDNINTILLKGKGHHDEGVLSSIVSPGEAIEFLSDGSYARQAKATADAIKSDLKIAKEDALQGKTISDDYASGDQVFFYTPIKGDVVHVLVKSGEDISLADVLVVEGGGSGLFIEAAGTEDSFQLEAVEAAGALAANTHVKCRVL